MSKNESQKIKEELINIYLAIKLRKDEDVILIIIFIYKIILFFNSIY